MLLQLEHDGALDIPPGDRDFLVSDDFRMPLDADLLAVYPHAHYLGKLLEGYATLPDGTRRWLIRIPDWDLNWQAVYRYREPLFLPKGAVISMRYHYDNSAANPRNPNSPPKRVVGGNQSTDEMAHLWLQVLPRGSGDRRAILQEAIMNRRLEKYPADFLANFNLGALFLNRQDIPSAVAHLAAALRVEPEQPAALNTFGVALESDGKLDEAVEQFRHALRLRPDDASARYNLANTLAAQGRLEDAAAGFRELLAGHSEDSAALEHLAKILQELGDSAASAGRLQPAAECYRELVGLEPRNADLRNNFGILLARSGDLASALAEFETALKLDPSHAAARRNLELTRQKMRH
jgi:Flp pilus assembly protein TadD